MSATSPKIHPLVYVSAIGMMVFGVIASVLGFVIEGKPLEGVRGLLFCALGVTQLLFYVAQRRSTRAGNVVALLSLVVVVALGVVTIDSTILAHQ